MSIKLSQACVNCVILNLYFSCLANLILKSFSLPQIDVNMGGEEEEEGRDGQTHYVVEQFVAEVRTARFKTESNKIRLV